jgi:hypothetical protein
MCRVITQLLRGVRVMSMSLANDLLSSTEEMAMMILKFKSRAVSVSDAVSKGLVNGLFGVCLKPAATTKTAF